MQIEKIQALYSSSPLMTGETLYRVQVSGLRVYRRENGNTYKSLTTFLDGVMPSNRFLQTWREQMAADLGSAKAATDYVAATADYGTILHTLIAEFVRNGGVNWAELPLYIAELLAQSGTLSADAIRSATDEMQRDFASLIQFLFDYEVEVLAVELPVWIDEGVATLIDLVVTMNAKAYTEKTEPSKRQRINAIINLKSGKKGFFDTHVYQLEGERRMYNQRFGEVNGNIEAVYNLAPNDWRTSPTYKLKDQSEAANAISDTFGIYLQLAKNTGLLSFEDRKITVFEGETKYGDSPAQSIKQISLGDLFTAKMAENDGQNQK